MAKKLDRAAVRELVLYAANDGRLYRSKVQPIAKNLARKKASGKFNKTLAVKAWRYLADDAAKKYAKEFGGTWYNLFPVPVRDAAAREFQSDYDEMVDAFAQDLVRATTPKTLAKWGTPMARAELKRRGLTAKGTKR